MSYSDFMNKVRYWDNRTAKWFMRHFYFMFFQIVLVGIFFVWFMNVFSVIDISQAAGNDIITRMLKSVSVNISILVLLLLLNSFWLLFMFNSMQRLATILRDISFYTSHLRHRAKKNLRD